MKMRSTSWRVASAVLGLSLLATACGGDDEPAATGGTTGDAMVAPEFEAGSTMAKLQASGTLRVGTKFDQPGFGLRSPSGDVEGFDVEIAKILADELFGEGGADKVEFTESVSANREPFLQNGEVDMVIATYTINDKRKELVGFAGPYYEAGQDIMVKSDDDSIKGIDDLNGKKVCSVDGSTSIKNLEEMAPDAAITSFDTYTKCAEALTDGRVDAVTTDNVILIGLIDQAGDTFKMVNNPFTKEPYGIGVPLEQDDLRDWINDVLEKIYTDGRWSAAWEKTAGVTTGSTPTPPAVNRY